VEAGKGLPFRTAQILILWEEPFPGYRYFYSGSGSMLVNGFDHCNGVAVIRMALDFFDFHEPDIQIPTPTLPPTPPAVLGAAYQPAAASNMCGEMEFAFPRDAKTFSGSCYGYYDSPDIFEKYEWSFTRPK